MDIMGIILSAIGGEKLKQVSTVFAEGTNITRQLGGGIGINSIMNQIPSLQNIMSTTGLSGVFSNPMSALTSSLSSNLSSAFSQISSMMTTTTSTSSSGGQGGNGSSSTTTTTTPTYPLFTAALTLAEQDIAQYYRSTQLLSGQIVPDYNNDEYGLSEILDVSSSGAAALNNLVAPLMINSVLTNALTQLTTLVQTAQSQSISDTSAVGALTTIMAPIMASVSQSQSAYNSATATSSSATALSQIVFYVDGSGSPESEFVSSLMSPSLANQVIAVNQAQTGIAQGNRATSTPEQIEHAQMHEERLQLIRQGKYEQELDSEFKLS